MNNISDLENKIQTKKKELAKKEANLSKLEQEKKEIKLDLQEKDGDIKKLNEDNAKINDEIGELEKRHNASQQKLKAGETKLEGLKEQKKQPRNIHTAGASSDQDIANVAKSIDDTKADMEHLERLLNEAKKKQTDNFSSLSNLEPKKTKLDEALAGIEKEISKAKESINDTQAEQADIDKLEKQLKSALLSTIKGDYGNPFHENPDMIIARNECYKYISSDICEFTDYNTGEITELKAGTEMYHWCFGPVKVSAFEERGANNLNNSKSLVGKVDILYPLLINSSKAYQLKGAGKVMLAFLFLDEDELLEIQPKPYGAFPDRDI